MRFAVLAAASVFATVGATGSSAVTLTKQNPYDTFNGGGKATVKNISSLPDTAVSAGGFRLLVDGVDGIIAWCLDVSHNLSLPSTYDVTTTPFTATTGDLSGRVGDIKNLFDVHYSTLNLDGGYGLTAGDKQSAAFQLALWELVYETSGAYNVKSGSWHADSKSAILNMANDMLGALGDAISQSYNLVFYESREGSQNLVSVVPVPLPAAGGMLGLAVLGLYAVGRWRKGPGIS